MIFHMYAMQHCQTRGWIILYGMKCCGANVNFLWIPLKIKTCWDNWQRTLKLCRMSVLNGPLYGHAVHIDYCKTCKYIDITPNLYCKSRLPGRDQPVFKNARWINNTNQWCIWKFVEAEAVPKINSIGRENIQLRFGMPLLLCIFLIRQIHFSRSTYSLKIISFFLTET